METTNSFLKTSNRSARNILIIVSIGVLALTLRIWGIDYGLPFLYNIDEVQVIPSAVRFGTGDLNPHTFTYPPFFKYLLFVEYSVYFVFGLVFGKFSSVTDFKMMYFNDPSVFYLIGRLTSAFMGALTVVVVYLLGKKAYNKAVGVIAALFLAVFALHMKYSRVALTDVPMTLFVILSIYFIYGIKEKPSTKNYFLAGLFGGLAITTKYTAGLIILPMAYVHFMNCIGKEKLTLKTLNLKPLLMSYAVLLVTFFIGNPFALLDFHSFWRDIRFNALVVSSKGNVFTGVVGYVHDLFIPSHFSQFGDYFGIVAIIGVIYALVRHSKTDLLLLAYPMVHLFYISFQTANLVMPRYMLPAVPLFYIFGARFLYVMIDKLHLSSASKLGITAAFVILMIIFPLKYAVVLSYSQSQKDTATLAREWIVNNIPSNTKILYTAYYDLELRENKESIIANSKIKQEKSNRFSSYTFAMPREKFEALANYEGPTYQILHLPQRWGGLTAEKAEVLGELPPGVAPVDLEKISFQYWKNRDVQYAIVFPHKIKMYFTSAGKTKYPQYYKYFSDLFKQAKLIKRFKPDYPRVPGYEIEIYSLRTNE